VKIFNTEVKGRVIIDKRLNNLDLESMVNPEKVAAANEIIRRIKLPETSLKSGNKKKI
jgi:hypothetical protein